jgi:transketolase
MALAESLLARRFNRPGHDIVDHHTWVFLGDGCMMEGISHEACALAGTLGLGKLIAFWDDNGISIDGEVVGWFTDDTPARFEAYGWQVIRSVDGHDATEIQQAIDTARAETSRPSLICCRTIIGYGSPNKQGTEATHGAALGVEEVAAARQALGWHYPPFEIPGEIADAWNARSAGQEAEQQWQDRFAAYTVSHPGLSVEFTRRMKGELPAEWAEHVRTVVAGMQTRGGDVATRRSSQLALEAFGPVLPELIGGSADLAGSNNTIWSGSQDVRKEGDKGNYIYFGVREFGMTAICNGLGLHGGFIPYNATFLVFSDYARNAVRMSALIPAHNIHVYTHDSIGLGEDGPTHQPVEHVASLRLIPALEVWRPCDTVESAVAWQLAIENRGRPSALIFTRQNLPHQPRDEAQCRAIHKGGYILTEAVGGKAAAILIATGSEVGLAVAAAKAMGEQGVSVRVVSMPNPGLFLRQDEAYRAEVLPPNIRARVAVEAGVSHYWHPFVGEAGRIVGVDRFGASAPAKVLFEHYGLTVENVCLAISQSMAAARA